MKNKRIIKKNHEFQGIINHKKSEKNSSFVIYYKKNEKGFFRYGISVGKKIGNAVLRNKIKRKTRSMIQTVLKTNYDCSFDTIIIVRANFLENDYNDSLQKLAKLLKFLKKGE